MTDEGAARPEPTIADAERIIRKIEACSGMAAKLVLLRNFIEFSASSSNAAPERKLWLAAINAELSQLREWANREFQRAEAAEAKVAALEAELAIWRPMPKIDIGGTI